MKFMKPYLFVLVCILAGSCGQKKPIVENQQKDYIRPPDFPSDAGESLQLTGDQGNSETTYQGAMIFWRNDVSKDDLAQVLRNKEMTSKLDLKYKREAFKLDDIKRDLKKIDDRIKKDRKRINEELNLDNFYRSQQNSIRQSTDKAMASYLDNKAFGRYCQAVLWSFGSSEILQNSSFISRPVPLGICESYFRKSGYFNGDECRENPRGQDYFNCIWGSTGIAKTDVVYYNDQFEKVTDAEKEKILKVFNSVQWRSAYKPDDFLILNLEIDGVEKEYYLDFNDADFFEGSDLVKDALDNLVFSENDPILRERIKSLIKERKTAGAVISAKKYNFNDRIYNMHLMNDVSANFELKNEDFSALLEATADSRELYGAIDKLQEKQRREQDLSELLESQAIFQDVKSKLENELEGHLGFKRSLALDAWTRQKFTTAKYISDKNMAAALWPFVELKIVELDEKSFELSLQIDFVRNTKIARACYDRVNYVEIPCGGNEDDFVSMPLSMSKETGVMDLAINLPEKLSFYRDPRAYSYRADGSLDDLFFQEQSLTKEFLAGIVLRLELLPGKIGSELPIFTGKAFLYDQDEKLFEASVNLSKAPLR